MEAKSVKGYYIHAAIDEMRSGRVKGPFFDRNIALMECDGAGWYGSPGELQEAWFLEFGEGRIAEYDPHKPLKFVDLERNAEKEMTEKIKSKLTKEEIEFLNLK